MSGDDEVERTEREHAQLERIAREYAPNAKPSEKIHVQRVEVIYVEWLAGAGTESEPYRTCQAYFTMGGEAIAVADPVPSEKQAPEGYSLIRNDVVEFLRGASPLEGHWFGDRRTDYVGTYWWRKFLPRVPRDGEDPDA